MNELTANPFPQNQITGPMGGQQNDLARAQMEVQGAIILAKKFPRDRFRAFNNIMQDCQRLGLAEKALYSYPRGGQQVTGPSIRLAETLAQNWGNLDFGVRELEQREGESLMEAYCWDLETNVRQAKTFIVKHERTKKDPKDKYKKITEVLTDSRDIYEMNANQGARRLRACILGIIPGDIVEKAIIQCEETLKKGEGKPLPDRVAGLAKAFQQEMGVTIEMLEERLQHKLEATSYPEFLSLHKIFTSIKDGVGSREQFFNVKTIPAKEVDQKAAELNNKFKV